MSIVIHIEYYCVLFKTVLDRKLLCKMVSESCDLNHEWICRYYQYREDRVLSVPHCQDLRLSSYLGHELIHTESIIMLCINMSFQYKIIDQAWINLWSLISTGYDIFWRLGILGIWSRLVLLMSFMMMIRVWMLM